MVEVVKTIPYNDTNILMLKSNFNELYFVEESKLTQDEMHYLTNYVPKYNNLYEVPPIFNFADLNTDAENPNQHIQFLT